MTPPVTRVDGAPRKRRGIQDFARSLILNWVIRPCPCNAPTSQRPGTGPEAPTPTAGLCRARRTDGYAPKPTLAASREGDESQLLPGATGQADSAVDTRDDNISAMRVREFKIRHGNANRALNQEAISEGQQRCRLMLRGDPSTEAGIAETLPHACHTSNVTLTSRLHQACPSCRRILSPGCHPDRGVGNPWRSVQLHDN